MTITGKKKKSKTIKPLHCPNLGECQFNIEEDVKKSKKINEKDVFGVKPNLPQKKKRNRQKNKTY